VESNQARGGSGRRSLILLIFLFSAPLVAAYFANRYLHDEGEFRTRNYGELIAPARPLTDVTLQTYPAGPFRFSDLRGKWVLIYIGTADCDPACEAALYKMRQGRLAQGEERDRVQRLYVSRTGKPGASLERVLAAHRGMIVAWGSDDAVRDLLRQFRVDGEQGAELYLVDPLGNLMMSYPPEFEAKGLVKDLTLLLKASQIG